MRQLFFHLIVLLLLLIPHLGYGQQEREEVLNGLYGDFDPSDLTAATLLGVNTNQVSKPASARALAGSLVQAATAYPAIGTGVAVEFAPVLLFPNTTVLAGLAGKNTLEEYRKFGKALTRNFTLSGASVSDSAAARLSAGVALVLFDGTDPLRSSAYVDGIVSALTLLKASDDYDKLTGDYSRSLQQSTQTFLKSLGIEPSTPERPDPDRLYAKISGLLTSIGGLPQSNASLPKPEDLLGSKQTDVQTLDTQLSSLVNTNKLTAGKKQAILTQSSTYLLLLTTAYPLYLSANKRLSDATAQVLKSAKEGFEKAKWNATIAQVGAGWVWASPEQRWNNLERQSFGYFARAAVRPASQRWASASGIRRFMYYNVSVVGNLRFNDFGNRQQIEPKSKSLDDSLQSKLWYGARLLLGNPRFRFSAEHAWQQLSYSDAAKTAAASANQSLEEALRSFTVGAEVRLAEKLWLEFAVGATYPKGDFSNQARLITLSSIKYSFRNEQRFKN